MRNYKYLYAKGAIYNMNLDLLILTRIKKLVELNNVSLNFNNKINKTF